MSVVDHNALESYSVAGVEHRTLAAARDGLRGIEVWDDLLYPGAVTAPCRHDCEKVVLVLAGHGELEIDGAVQAFVAPCTLIVARGRLSAICNRGDRVMSLITVFGATPPASFAADGTAAEQPWTRASRPGLPR